MTPSSRTNDTGTLYTPCTSAFPGCHDDASNDGTAHDICSQLLQHAHHKNTQRTHRYAVCAATSPNHTRKRGVKSTPVRSSRARTSSPLNITDVIRGTGTTGTRA